MKKKVILNIESVYTANAFQIGSEMFVAAGSETKPEVYLYNLTSGISNHVSGCPGGVMSFIPVPGSPDLFFSIMGLFPPFIGAEAGVFMHRKTGDKWETHKAMDLPFAHRCEILNRNGKNHLFAASVSKYKENPPDWSRPGEMFLIRLDEDIKLPLKPELIDNTLTRNHGMLRTHINGTETVCMSGVDGIFYFEQQPGDNWVKKMLFDKEVSEFCFIDLDGDGHDELVTIEPFHGEALNVYKNNGQQWELKFTDSLSFGHGLSCGFLNAEPVIVVGNRRGSFTLDMFKVTNLDSGNFSREVIEEDAGPTQTQVFTAGNTDYILSANQKKNEVALYYQ
jgi:hypothetical protein